ncbi:DUF4430 domain-containing protein [[Clostridium] spiroforme]|nr:DUF4430 domain-containing protein [Thomasclavelia spiroformis]
MNKTKKYLIVFLAVCFVFIVSVGIKQTFWSNQADNQVISHKEEKKTAAKTNENDVKATQENDENETSVQESKTENEEESKSTTDTSQTTNKTSEKKSTNQSSSTQQNSNITASSQPSEETQNNSSKPVETVSYNLVIKGKGSYVLQENITIQDGQTVYDVLISATKQHHIEFQAIESQYGMYVVNIGGLKAANYGGNANNGWVYEINGSHVGTSADKKILKSTDQIEWIYLY